MPSTISKLLEYKVLPIGLSIERAQWNLRCLIKKRVLCEKKEDYHCKNQSQWIGFLIIRLFGNQKVIILFTGVIFPNYLIPKVISDYLSIAFREKLMTTVAKHVIILVIMWSLATPYAGLHKLLKRFLKLPRSIFTVAERKQSGAVISLEEWNWKSGSATLQFRTPFERFFSF